MSAAAVLIQMIAKTFFFALPACVGWLAFRRLVMSETSNAWIYASVGMFAAFSAAGLAPWVFGFQSLNWIFLVAAFLCPPIWLATIIICGMGRASAYDVDAEAEIENVRPPKPPVLVLEEPIFPKLESEPSPVVFKSHRQVLKTARKAVSKKVMALDVDRNVLEVARAMRGNESTNKRRERPLLPPPHAMSDLPNLPFLQR